MDRQKQDVGIVGELLLQAREKGGGLALAVQQHGATYAELAGQPLVVLAGAFAGRLFKQREGLGAAAFQREVDGTLGRRGLLLAPGRSAGQRRTCQQ